jgi:Pentapeptide repeats (8 copies)
MIAPTEVKLITDGIYFKGVGRDRMSPHHPVLYDDGMTVEADSLDTDLSDDCAPGIHVCETIAEALRWGPVVLRVQIGDTLVRVNSKLRTNRVTVCGPVSLVGANLAYAYLAYANLAYVNLRCAVLVGANLACANLACANLRGANLDGANLRYARLEGANLDGTYLDGVAHNELTRWPASFAGVPS